MKKSLIPTKSETLSFAQRLNDVLEGRLLPELLSILEGSDRYKSWKVIFHEDEDPHGLTVQRPQMLPFIFANTRAPIHKEWQGRSYVAKYEYISCETILADLLRLLGRDLEDMPKYAALSGGQVDKFTHMRALLSSYRLQGYQGLEVLIGADVS